MLVCKNTEILASLLFSRESGERMRDECVKPTFTLNPAILA